MNWKAEVMEVFKWFLNVFEICCCIAKTRKEAKQMATRDSISAIKARVGELKRTVQVQSGKRNEYEAIISQQSLGNYLSLQDRLIFMVHVFHNCISQSKIFEL